jgi:hypothetical protein
MVQLSTEVRIIETIRMIISAGTMAETPSHVVRTRSAFSAMNDDTMKMPAWAKFTMLRMPNTIV